jgi:hypothetical protein
LKKNNVLYRAIGSETIEVAVSIMYVIYKLTLTPFNIITVGDRDETVKSSEINAVNIFMTWGICRKMSHLQHQNVVHYYIQYIN